MMPERVFCTIVTKNYLAYARTLAETLEEHNPQSRLYVLLADQIEDCFQPDAEPFELIRLEDLPDQKTIEQMSFYYTPLEFCCALRGLLHEYIIEHTTAESWIFLDCDILVCSSLESIFEVLSETSILLTPHCNIPLATKEAEHEISILKHGLSNAGFLGLRRTEQTRNFLAWWKDRLTYYCFLDSAIGDPRGLSVDQLWLNLALLYFPDFKFLKHPGANIGHWNFYEKTFERDSQGTVTVNQQPLLFLHFSGWEIDKPHFVSRNSPLYPEKITSAWAELAELYRTKLLKNGYEVVRQFSYTFGSFRDRTAITQVMRRGYYDELKQGVAVVGSPFDQAEYFRSKQYSLNSTHFLREEIQVAYQHVVQLQQQNHQIHTVLQQTQDAYQQAQITYQHTQSTLNQTQTALDQTQAAFLQYQQQAEAELENSRQRLEEMQKSSFWKLRNFWWRLKRKLRIAETTEFDRNN